MDANEEANVDNNEDDDKKEENENNNYKEENEDDDKIMKPMIILQATTVSDLTTAKACLSDPSVSCICPNNIQTTFNSLE